MGSITLTIAAPWQTPPALETDLSLSWEAPDEEVIDELLWQVEQTGRLTKGVERALKAHAGFLIARGEIERPGDAKAAKAAAALARDALEAGALAVLIEESGKVLLPGDIDPEAALKDSTTLLHLFVEIFIEGLEVCVEGMQIFGLPDARVPFTPATLEAAQGVAFAFAARALLERLRPTPGGVFRASESAPLYRTRRVEDEHNPAGAWVLELEA